MFYLDIHSHILPGVDDGARDWEETKQMLKMAYDQGVHTMIATPHSYPNEPKKNSSELRNLVSETEELAKTIAEDFKIFPGNEVLYRESIPKEVEQGNILTLADSQYILVEFLPQEHYARILHGVRRLMEFGYCPVIAHIERVNALYENVERIQEITEIGAYLQVNAGSLLGGIFHKKSNFLCNMIEEGYIHFLGSDCHNSRRPPIMEETVRKLRKKVSKEVLEQLLYENPLSLLNKKYI